MSLEEYKGVFVYAQQVDNEISGIAFELLGKANELAKDLEYRCNSCFDRFRSKRTCVDTLAEYGADKVIVVDDPELERLQNRAIYACACFRNQ